MGSGWMRAFRAVPWSEVIAAAPAVVASAKKILAGLQKRQQSERSATRMDPVTPPPADPELRALHQRIVDLKADLVEATQVLDNLAQQHAQLVIAVEALRKRTQTLAWTCLGLAVVVAGLVLWLALR